MYLLDANTYIQAMNYHYDMDFCPAYWHWLESQFRAQRLASIKHVYVELDKKSDKLTDWVSDHKEHFLTNTDDLTQAQFSLVANWVAESGLSSVSISKFLSGADPWLIAKALTIPGATVVTHESLVAANSSQVKIPNVCVAFGVQYATTYQLLRELQANFVLGPPLPPVQPHRPIAPPPPPPPPPPSKSIVTFK